MTSGRSRNTEANGSVPRSTMEELKEESSSDGDRDAALAKLTQRANGDSNPSTTNGTVPNGVVKDPSAHDPAATDMANGSADVTANHTPPKNLAIESAVPNEAVPKAIATDPAAKPTTNGILHNSTPFVQNLQNHSANKGTDHIVSLSPNDPLTKMPMKS